MPPVADPDSTAAVHGRARADALVDSEAGLSRDLGPRQLAMIAIGGAIGTGLFLGSALAVRMAGPAVILAYAFGALLALMLTRALAEMAVAHPTAGSVGVYAEAYTSGWAGFTVRYSYWAAQAIVIGGDAIAVAIYCQWWFPAVPSVVWIAGVSLLLVGINSRGVWQFGAVEYVFSAIKLVAIAGFVVFGGLLIFGGVPGSPAVGLANLTEHGGFMPMGLLGVWFAVSFVVFGFVGTEVVAVTAGEAADPATAVPRALRSVVLRLALFYVGAVFVLVALVPWNAEPAGSDITASPFVSVFERIGFPAAAHLINFVVVTAAVSSMNCNLYFATRMLFSLSRGGYAPAAFGRVNARGVPTGALAATASGLLVAILVATWSPDTAYLAMFGTALFGALFGWLMSFITHLRFRRAWAADGNRPLPLRLRGAAIGSAFGAVAVLGVTASTWWVPHMDVTLKFGLPWLAVLSLVYFAWFRRKS